MRKPTAIVYTSNTGFTAKYAQMLARASGIPAYDTKERWERPPAGAAVLYLGWLCAGGIKGLKAARGRYRLQAVCGVGLTPADEGYAQTVRAQNHLEELPFFYLQGGYAPEKLTGPYRLMMGAVSKLAGTVQDQTGDAMAALFSQGSNAVSLEALAPILAWLDQP